MRSIVSEEIRKLHIESLTPLSESNPKGMNFVFLPLIRLFKSQKGGDGKNSDFRSFSFDLDSNDSGFFVKIVKKHVNGYTSLLVPEGCSRFGFRFVLAHLIKAGRWF